MNNSREEKGQVEQNTCKVHTRYFAVVGTDGDQALLLIHLSDELLSDEANLTTILNNLNHL